MAVLPQTYTQEQINQLYQVPVPIKSVDAYQGGRQAWIGNQRVMDQRASQGGLLGGVPTAGGPGQVPGPAPGPGGTAPNWQALQQMTQAGMTPQQIQAMAGQRTGAPNWQALQQLTQSGMSPQQIQNLATSRSGQMTPTGESGFQTYNPTMQPGAPKYGLMGAEDAMQRGLTGGIAGIEAGMNQAGQTLSPYTDRGAKAFDLQSALSGALGPAAQKQAFANYNQSPEMAYALQQAEKGITRNAAATGGLKGGNVLSALQQNAIGMAQQDFGNSFNRLGSLSAMGQNSANLLGGLQANAGGKVGDYAFGTGQAMASGRTRAGEMIANNVQGTSASLAEMMQKQGTDLSSIIGAGGGSIAQMLANYGQLDAATQQELAKLLGNIASGSATTVAGASQLPGVSDPGLLGGLGAAAGGIGSAMSGYAALGGGAAAGAAGATALGATGATIAPASLALAAFSDIRLKKNIRKIGSLTSGTNLYSWEWNDIGAGLAGSQPTVGVIAQEVNEDAVIVGDHGYLMVDYSRVR